MCLAWCIRMTEPTGPEPASEDNADELLRWYNKYRLAICAIRLNISGSVLPFIVFPSKSTALELWDRLKDFPTTREFQKATVFQRWSTMMLGKSCQWSSTAEYTSSLYRKFEVLVSVFQRMMS